MIRCIGCGCEFEQTSRSRKCLECRRLYEREWRARRKAEGRPIISQQTDREWHREYEAEYYARPEIRERLAARMRARYYDPNEKPKHLARSRVQREIKMGRLVRQPCEMCGDPLVHTHHDDYSRPLDVRWLCLTHHVAVHAKAKAEAARQGGPEHG